MVQVVLKKTDSSVDMEELNILEEVMILKYEVFKNTNRWLSEGNWTDIYQTVPNLDVSVDISEREAEWKAYNHIQRGWNTRGLMTNALLAILAAWL